MGIDEIDTASGTVAVVVADSRGRAKDAAGAVEVEYELLDALTDTEAALVHSKFAIERVVRRIRQPADRRSMASYRVPSAAELPAFETDSTVTTPASTNPMGVKGVGETGTIAAPPAR